MPDHGHPEEDLLLEVALGSASEQGRDQAGEHLSACAQCRHSQEHLVEGIDLTLPAVPRTAPPPGFDTRVLDRLRQEQASESRRNPGDRRRFRWLPVAAAILLGVAIGGTGVQVLDDDPEQAPTVATTWDAPLLAADGSDVGGVSRGSSAAGSYLVLTLSNGTAGSTYLCRVVLADGTVQDLARWEVSGYNDDVWVIDEPVQGVQRIELLDETGEVWATAAW